MNQKRKEVGKGDASADVLAPALLSAGSSAAVVASLEIAVVIGLKFWP